MTTPPEDRPLEGGQRRRSRHLPGRVAFLLSALIVVLIATSTSSVRSWWAHRLHDVTGGNRTADYLIGLAVGLLPVIGVGLGMIRARGPRRIMRMFLYGAIGFVATYLLAPSPARYLAHHASTRVFAQQAPSYLAGVVTGIACWLVLALVAVLRVRASWRRLRDRHRDAGPVDPDGRRHRVIDV